MIFEAKPDHIILFQPSHLAAGFSAGVTCGEVAGTLGQPFLLLLGGFLRWGGQKGPACPQPLQRRRRPATVGAGQAQRLIPNLAEVPPYYRYLPSSGVEKGGGGGGSRASCRVSSIFRPPSLTREGAKKSAPIPLAEKRREEVAKSRSPLNGFPANLPISSTEGPYSRPQGTPRAGCRLALLLPLAGTRAGASGAYLPAGAAPRRRIQNKPRLDGRRRKGLASRLEREARRLP